VKFGVLLSMDCLSR